MNFPEASPLYQPGFSHEERNQIQTHNFELITAAFEYVECVEAKQIIPLPCLIVNGTERDDVYLQFSYKPSKTVASIATWDRNLSRRFVHASFDPVHIRGLTDIPVKYWEIGSSGSLTTKGYEGNGFGTALLFGFESLYPYWVEQLSDPQRVIAVGYDNSRGAEEEERNGTSYRLGWTSSMMQSLGYDNRTETLTHLLGPSLAERSRYDGGKTWVKLLRN